jgi:anti-sigma regulatory factor (Ser/Thr protein kinase)
MAEVIRIRVPGDAVYLKWVHTLTAAILVRLPLSGQKKHHLLVAMSEGFTNAFLHGNQQEPGYSVTLMYEIDSDSVQITVQDEGMLPIDSNIDHLIKPVHASEESGRGLGLIREMTDEVSITHEPEQGNILTMKTYFNRQCGKGKAMNEEEAYGNYSQFPR